MLAVRRFDPREGSGNSDLYLIDMTGNEEPRALVATAANEAEPTISPDGRWLAYSSSESGQFEIVFNWFEELERLVPTN